jgi:hypothetical protein
MRIIETADADVASGVKRAVLENIFEKAAPGGGNYYVGIPVNYSPQKLNSLLTSRWQNLEAIFANDPHILRNLGLMREYASRMISREGMGASPTAPRLFSAQWFGDVIDIGKKVLTGQLMEAQRSFWEITRPAILAKIMFSEKGTADFLKVARSSAKTKSVIATLGRLSAGFAARDEWLEFVNQGGVADMFTREEQAPVAERVPMNQLTPEQMELLQQ